MKYTCEVYDSDGSVAIMRDGNDIIHLVRATADDTEPASDAELQWFIDAVVTATQNLDVLASTTHGAGGWRERVQILDCGCPADLPEGHQEGCPER